MTPSPTPITWRPSDKQVSIALSLALLNLDPRTMRVCELGANDERYQTLLREWRKRRTKALGKA